jgi:sucrose phosphorylase
LEKLIDSPITETGQVFHEYVRRLQIRRGVKAFHPDAPQHVLDLPDGLFGLVRISLDTKQQILVLHNLTSQSKTVDLEALTGRTGDFHDLLHPEPADIEQGVLHMRPYKTVWLLMPAVESAT